MLWAGPWGSLPNLFPLPSPQPVINTVQVNTAPLNSIKKKFFYGASQWTRIVRTQFKDRPAHGDVLPSGLQLNPKRGLLLHLQLRLHALEQLTSISKLHFPQLHK